MNNSKNASPAPLPTRGISRDLSRLRQDGGASVAEVRDFVRQMRGRSPQEVLGLVAQSSLVHGVTTATIATVVLMLAATLGPYWMGWGKKPKPVATPAPAAAPAAVPTEAAKPADGAASTAAGEPASKTPDKEKVANALGENEAKQAAPDRNPLEDKGDDLLKDIK